MQEQSTEQLSGGHTTQPHIGFVRIIIPLCFAVLALAYAAIWFFADINTETLKFIWFVPLIGIFGAVIANSTGVGGGVVFIPVFLILGSQGKIDISTATIVGVSFMIQCFGMTTGSLSWLKSIILKHKTKHANLPKREFLTIIAVCLTGALPAMLATQWLNLFSQEQALYLFKGFSLVLGAALLITHITGDKYPEIRDTLHKGDLVVLFFLSVIGGVATALFSVGVGELMALYLFLRHYPGTTAVAPAVIVSAISVIIGGIYHIQAYTVLWEIIVLAAPGALIGAWIARRIATAVTLRSLKFFSASWIVVSSIWLIIGKIS